MIKNNPGKTEISNSIQGLTCLIGNTPLFEIEFLYKGKPGKIYAKAEHLNMTGSIKDRMALQIIREAYRKNLIKPGDRVIEATSGNAGIAFAAVGRALGHPVTIFMPDWMSEERKNLIRSFGADIVLVSKEEGGFLGSINRTREMAASDPDSFLPDQFENEDNTMAHYTTTKSLLTLRHFQTQKNWIVQSVFASHVHVNRTNVLAPFFCMRFPPKKDLAAGANPTSL